MPLLVRGTIFTWIPRFAYKENGEIKYAKEEIQPGGEWTIPDMFIYAHENETKADFSLSGIWLQKDVDTSYSSKITEMKKEEGKYGFLAHTKPVQITSGDTTSLQTYVGADASVRPQINDITNTNRIILKIVNTRKLEPIKAKIEHNTIEQKIEIQVTYTTNGIKSIIDEYGDSMTFTEQNGIILTDTGEQGLANGIYYFTVIDNKDNRKELSVDVTIDSLFKVAYITGTDDMNNLSTYNKTQGTLASGESDLLSQIRTQDTSTTYSRAIKDRYNAVTAIGEEARTSDDEQMYLYSKYNVNSKTTYSWKYSHVEKNAVSKYSAYGYPSIVTNSQTGIVTTSGSYGSYVNRGGRYNVSGNDYYEYGLGTDSKLNKTYYVRESNITYSRGTFIGYVVTAITSFPQNGRHASGYWFIRHSLIPKYTLYKYDENLKLKSTYDVETKVLTTEPIALSSKENNKVQLTLTAAGTDYKTYISNDNTTWQEVTDITSGTAKELNVDGWDKLYIKIETNTSRIDNIDVAYYKN